MSTESIARKIKDLFVSEYDVASKFEGVKLPDDGLNTYDNMLAASRSIMQLDRSGSRDPRLYNWGHWAQMPLPHILAIQGQVIVDLFPISVEEFPSKYGVTFDQFKHLCKERMLICNVFEDGVISNDLDDWGTVRRSAYLRYPELEPIFDHDEFGTRVLGVRRQALLESFGITLRAQERATNQYFNLLSSEVLKHPMELLNKILAGSESSNHEGVTARLANNLLYIDIFGTAADKQVLYRLESASRFSDLDDQMPFLEFAKWSRGRKTDLASPITAAYGGTFNTTETEHLLREKYRSVAGPIESMESRRLVSAELAALAEFQANASQIRVHGSSDVSNEPLELWRDNQLFEDFVSFIKERRTVLAEVDLAIWKSPHITVSGDGYYDFTDWYTYLELVREAYRDPSREHGIVKRIRDGVIVGGAAGTAVEVAELIRHPITRTIDAGNNLTRRVFISMGVGAALGGAGVGYEELISEEHTEKERAARRLITKRMEALTGLKEPYHLYH